MFRRFLAQTAKDLVASTSGVPPWLNDARNPFIFTLHLHGVADPLDPDVLWDHQYSGGAAIREAATNRADRRLRLALDAHRQVMVRHDEERGYAVEDPQVFTDVLIRVSPDAWKPHRQVGSGRIPVMLDKLAHRHNQDFQDHLFGGRMPRYLVVPEERLKDGEVLCQFGLGVFVPDAEDRLRGDVLVRIDGQEMPLPEWEGYNLGRGRLQRITRPAGLYQDQHYLLLSGDCHQSAIRSPAWLPDREGYLLVNLAGDPPELEPDDGPVQALDLEEDLDTGERICRFHNADPTNPRTLEVIVRLDQAAARAPSIAGTRTSGTIVFTGRSAAPRLMLSGIALPRIDPYSGLAEWSLRLDLDGRPSPDASGGALLKGRVGDDALRLRRAGARRDLQVQVPVQGLDSGPGCVPLVIDTLPLREYLGLLRFATPREFLIPRSKTGGAVIGRAPDGTEAGIPLTLLAQPGSLLWEDNHARGALNDLISSRFAELIPNTGGLCVRQLSETAPIYLLDETLSPLQTLEPGSGGEAEVRAGQHLLLGLYLLRYQPARTARS